MSETVENKAITVHGDQLPVPRAEEQQVTTPISKSKVDRIVSHARTLTEDLTDLVEIQMQLARVQLEEGVNRKFTEFRVQAVVMVVVALGGAFVLLAAALGLGVLLGHAAWGFLLLGSILIAGAFLLWKLKPRFFKPRVGSDNEHSSAK